MSVSTLTPELIRNCRRCGRDLNLGALVCENCHALVHSEELDRLADSARILESQGQFRQARETWLLGLRFLPPNSTQADWINQHAQALEQTAAQIQPIPKSDHAWAKRLGPLAPIAILLAKFKFLFTALFKLKFLFSFVAFFGLYWAMWGPKFGIGFAVMILIHEMGHYIDIKRRGLPADMPVFLPGLGAYVKWQGLGVSRETRAAISLAGPLAGLLAALACAGLWLQTGGMIWAALARTGAYLNLVNLIPVPILDGGNAARALSKIERIVLFASCLALWLLTSEGPLLFVALGFGYQIFLARDFPAHPSRKTTVYFIGVLTVLAALLRVLPTQGFGVR